ncbi:hypothetical protein NX059_002389 [Plenodomus lindquistii]|nr:hypothetical protein NX059_002389 [Plenodomus lindquistii]
MPYITSTPSSYPSNAANNALHHSFDGIDFEGEQSLMSNHQDWPRELYAPPQPTPQPTGYAYGNPISTFTAPTLRSQATQAQTMPQKRVRAEDYLDDGDLGPSSFKTPRLQDTTQGKPTSKGKGRATPRPEDSILTASKPVAAKRFQVPRKQKDHQTPL